jgi:hypothetical protein
MCFLIFEQFLTELQKIIYLSLYYVEIFFLLNPSSLTISLDANYRIEQKWTRPLIRYLTQMKLNIYENSLAIGPNYFLKII